MCNYLKRPRKEVRMFEKFSTNFERKTAKNSSKKIGFTLAEVLITLGIIGVVAALTLPTLIQNYKNHVVETRLKKFYTVYNQAIMRSESIYGDKKDWYVDAVGVDLDEEGNVIEESSKIEQWFKKYLPDLIIIKKEIMTNGHVYYYLPDGSAFSLGNPNQPSMRDITFFPNNPKKCKPIQDLGKCAFGFEYYPISKSQSWKYHYDKGLEPGKVAWDGNIETLKRSTAWSCYDGSGWYCTALIQMNGWKIPKDYPFKVK